MDVRKQDNLDGSTGNVNEQSLEQLHRSPFDHPSDEEWSATRSLAQPSFLKQVDSRGSGRSEPIKVSLDAPTPITQDGCQSLK